LAPPGVKSLKPLPLLKTKSLDHRGDSVSGSSTATGETGGICRSWVKCKLEESWLVPWCVKACQPYKRELQRGSIRSRCGAAMLLRRSLRGRSFALLLAVVRRWQPCHSGHILILWAGSKSIIYSQRKLFSTFMFLCIYLTVLQIFTHKQRTELFGKASIAFSVCKTISIPKHLVLVSKM